jgi:GT2 family glycosyltransferase
VFQVVGACLMLRPVERFDERFFLYGEDTDLCRRLNRHGQVVYEPAAVFTHELGSSSVGPGRWRSVAHYNRGKELYFALHHGRPAAIACLLLDRLGAALRLLIWGVPTLLTLGRVRRFRDRALLFLRVLTAPVAGPRVSRRGAAQGSGPLTARRPVGAAPGLLRAVGLFLAWLERVFPG